MLLEVLLSLFSQDSGLDFLSDADRFHGVSSLVDSRMPVSRSTVTERGHQQDYHLLHHQKEPPGGQAQ